MGTLCRWRCVAAGLALAGAGLAACSNRSVMTRPVEPVPEAAAETPMPEVSVVAVEPVEISATVPPEASPDQVAPVEESPAMVATPPSPRTDGRPEWWSDRPAYEVERVWVCAEALGKGMSEAKEAALLRARRQLREILRLGDSDLVPGEVVERTSVTPLPRSGGDHAFAGYVLISAELP